jgi:hypothetical protein
MSFLRYSFHFTLNRGVKIFERSIHASLIRSFTPPHMSALPRFHLPWYVHISPVAVPYTRELGRYVCILARMGAYRLRIGGYHIHITVCNERPQSRHSHSQTTPFVQFPFTVHLQLVP